MKDKNQEHVVHMYAYLKYYDLDNAFRKGFCNPFDIPWNNMTFEFMKWSDSNALNSDWKSIGKDFQKAFIDSIN